MSDPTSKNLGFASVLQKSGGPPPAPYKTSASPRFWAYFRLGLGFGRTFGWLSRKIVYDSQPECWMPWRMCYKCRGEAEAMISHTPGNRTFWPRVVIYYLLINFISIRVSTLSLVPILLKESSRKSSSKNNTRIPVR